MEDFSYLRSRLEISDIPKEWFALSYDDFLEYVITLAAAKHYGFTVDDLKERKGLKEFFGFTR